MSRVRFFPLKLYYLITYLAVIRWKFYCHSKELLPDIILSNVIFINLVNRVTLDRLPITHLSKFAFKNYVWLELPTLVDEVDNTGRFNFEFSHMHLMITMSFKSHCSILKLRLSDYLLFSRLHCHCMFREKLLTFEVIVHSNCTESIKL